MLLRLQKREEKRKRGKEEWEKEEVRSQEGREFFKNI